MISYFFEAMGIQLLFLVLYMGFFRRMTFFRWNRTYLVSTFLLSWVLPGVQFSFLQAPELLPAASQAVNNGRILLDEIVLSASTDALLWPELLIRIWILGSLFFLCLFIWKITYLLQLRSFGHKTRFKGFTLVEIPDSQQAFSFFNTIFLGSKLPAESSASILEHERAHVRQFHSLDLMFLELFRIIFWFNPLNSFYQKQLIEVHEYLADRHMIKLKGSKYFEDLISQVLGIHQLSFVNPFFKSSLIKKRIVMLKKSPSKTSRAFKYVMLLPVLIGILCYTSCETKQAKTAVEIVEIPEDSTLSLNVDEQTDELISQKRSELISLIETSEVLTEEEKKNMIQGIANDEEKSENEESTNLEGLEKEMPFAVVDEVPVFPGCESVEDKRGCFGEKLIEHVMKHFNYPEEAMKEGLEGQVYVVFSVDTDGSITNIKKRGRHELLEMEAERIIKKLPKMQPGKHNGEAIKVLYAIPITFKLN